VINSIRSLDIVEFDREYFDIQGAYGYNGVVSSCHDGDFIKAFHTCFDEFCRKQNIVAEFMRFHPIIENVEFSKDYMTVIKDRQTVFIDLTEDYDTISGNYKASNRKKIRKALKRDLQIRYSNDEESFKAFYRLYTETMDNASADDYYR
jgi:predicted N-acyltransferase